MSIGLKKTFKHSTEEQWTGDFWDDEKKIYSKIIRLTITPTSTSFGVNHDISNLGSYRRVVDATLKSSSGVIRKPYYVNSNYFFNVEVFAATYLGVNVGQSLFSSAEYEFVLEYTKTTD